MMTNERRSAPERLCQVKGRCGRAVGGRRRLGAWASGGGLGWPWGGPDERAGGQAASGGRRRLGAGGGRAGAGGQVRDDVGGARCRGVGDGRAGDGRGDDDDDDGAAGRGPGMNDGDEPDCMRCLRKVDKRRQSSNKCSNDQPGGRRWVVVLGGRRRWASMLGGGGAGERQARWAGINKYQLNK